jgi:hypothetical protein
MLAIDGRLAVANSFLRHFILIRRAVILRIKNLCLCRFRGQKRETRSNDECAAFHGYLFSTHFETSKLLLRARKYVYALQTKTLQFVAFIELDFCFAGCVK